MNEQLKVLPTEFEGITFRSRTEARWAVFFEAIGWVWEHEREGFDVNGRWYLPDFHLPDFPMWFEVKPDETDGSEAEHFSALCRLSKKAGIIAYGPPKAGRGNLLHFDKEGLHFDKEGRSDDRYALFSDRRNDGEFWMCRSDSWFSIGPEFGPDHAKDPVILESLRKAFESAGAEKFGT
jgi:hypothetical protein